METVSPTTLWKCSLCTVFVAVTLRILMNHYYTVHSNEVNFSVRCGVNDCPATFQRYHSFYKHVKRRHKNEYEVVSSKELDKSHQTCENVECSSSDYLPSASSCEDQPQNDFVFTEDESTNSDDTDDETVCEVYV